MATRDPKRVSDGVLSMEAGIDSGRAPNLLATNQGAFAVNTTFRGGWPTCRPAWVRRTMDFQSVTNAETNFRTGLYQVAGGYTYDNGDGSIMACIGGRQWRINLPDYTVQEISIAGDLNPSNKIAAWCCQGENYWILQDGQSKPFIYDGSTSRRAGPKEIPTGKQITYYMGRFWIADGRFYVAADGVYGNGYRSNVLNFIENDFLSEGGAFGIPAHFGDITALFPLTTLDTAIGQSAMVVGAVGGMCVLEVPADRTTWKNLTNPAQRVIQLSSGPTAQSSTVGVNSDVFYRALDGVRSLISAVRSTSTDWGNTGISNEMFRILPYDAQDWLKYSSGVLFDNRVLLTTSPGYTADHGVWHRALAVLDFTPITGMRQKLPPAWEGIWTGLNILQIFKVTHQQVERCFAFVLNSDDEIELWELTKEGKFDNEEVRIEWAPITRAMDFGDKFAQKDLETADIFRDRITGKVETSVYWKPDSHPCWFLWDSTTDCAKFETCDADLGACPTLAELKEQYRPKWQLKQPPDSFDPNTGELLRRFFELQVRPVVKGYCRLKQLRFNAYVVQEEPSGRESFVTSTDPCVNEEDCCTDELFFYVIEDDADYTPES